MARNKYEITLTNTAVERVDVDSFNTTTDGQFIDFDANTGRGYDETVLRIRAGSVFKVKLANDEA